MSTPFFNRGDRVIRLDTGDTATVTTAEKNGFVEVSYDLDDKGAKTHPMLQFASKFRKL